MQQLGTTILTLVALGLMLVSGSPAMADPVKIRVGVLEFGTVSWELDTISHHGFDTQHGIELEMVGLAGRDATSLALRSGEVDAIVIDWIWVSRERAQGYDYTFMPFSKAVGALVVPAESDIQDVADLEGRHIGIAGGPLDKSWLLLRALAEMEHGLDLETSVEAAFGAPPLLNEQLRLGRLDGVITYWHFVAMLEAEGMRRVLDVSDAGRRLGLESDVPLLGFVFKESWADENEDAVLGLLEASLEAKDLLATDDSAWERLRPRMQVEDEAVFVQLREGYRAGIPSSWGDQERSDAEQLFSIMAEFGGEELVGDSERLEPGTFWDPARF
jgi:NitT/TauT family transport system substrate-binding protein